MGGQREVALTKIVTVEQMRSIEKAAEAGGLSYDSMMKNAGRSVAQAILARIADIRDKHVLTLVGKGNNGGDGLVAANLLADAGASIAIYLTEDREVDDPYLGPLRDRGVLIVSGDQDQRSRVLKLQLGRADIVIDAVLGTGIQLPLRGSARELLKAVQQIIRNLRPRPFTVAVDCPSGLDCDTGQLAGETLRADMTVSLAAVKPGLFMAPGMVHVGKLVIGDIGLPDDFDELDSIQSELATADAVRQRLPERPSHAHKGSFGWCIVVAGSIQYPGAAVLAGRAAYLTGAGLVTLAVPEPIQTMLAPQLPECTWLPLPHEGGALTASGVEALRGLWRGAQSLLLGPGFGIEPSVEQFLESALDPSAGSPLPPCIVDADGLKLLARLSNWWKALPAESVLTPHPGEMSVMIGKPTEEIQSNRIDIAREYAAKWGHTVVLKGAHTVVANPDGRTTVMPFATSALATAGTGDVLAGAIAGLMAQGLAGYSAAVLAGFIHGRAGQLAADRVGTEVSVLASDVADAIPASIRELERQEAN